jgi:hypothetical protein
MKFIPIVLCKNCMLKQVKDKEHSFMLFMSIVVDKLKKTKYQRRSFMSIVVFKTLKKAK